jgi:hypothetical protein
MKRNVLFSLVICVLSSWLQARTPAMAGNEKPASETVHISLNGSWKLFYFPQGKYQIRPRVVRSVLHPMRKPLLESHL